MKHTWMKLCALGAGLWAQAAVAAPLFEATFDKGLTQWGVSNHGKFSVIEGRASHAGASNVFWVSKAKDATKGTAWEIRSKKPFAVTPGERIRVTIRAIGSVPAMRHPSGFKGNFETAIRWQGADGKPLEKKDSYFGFEVSPFGWRWSFAEITVPEGAARACLSLGADRPDFKADDYVAVSCVRVERADARGKTAHTTALRDDGVTLVDGQPFFPIGIYTLIRTAFNDNSFVKALADLKAVGFNTVQILGREPPDVHRDFLDACVQTGMMQLMQPAYSYEADLVTNGRIREVMNHPSLLCWYLADDTASHAIPDEVAYRRRICRFMDGASHLTMQADGVFYGDINRYEPFVDSTDVFMPEIYPCREAKASGREVAETVRDMRAIRAALAEHNNPTKGIWPILQCFEGWSSWRRFPELRELRAMAWASMALGAKGLMWYAYTSRNPVANHGMVYSAETWRRTAEVTKEIAAHRDDLLARDAPVQPTVEILSGPREDPMGNPSVSALLKTGEDPLFIAVNSSTNAVTARFTSPTFSRTLVFEPYGVQLLRTGRR